MGKGSGPPPERHFTAQAVGAYVGHEQAERAAELSQNLDVLQRAYDGATGELAKLREFVSVPGGILGNPDTKHGEIAEHVEVAVRNARDLMAHRLPTAVIDGVPRTGPVDYLIGGDEVQSKFINGARNTLKHVASHLEKYPEFGEAGRWYHIPKDQHAQILRTLAGTEGELSERSQRTLIARVREIEAAMGRPFEEAVQPSVSTYPEVQQGKIMQTIDGHQEQVEQSRTSQEASHRADAGPSLEGAAGAAVVGAAVGATVQLMAGIIAKVREGKNPLRNEFTLADWKEVGLKTGEGALKGGVSAAAIYGLTNCADMAAPFAGAFVSSTLAVKDLHDRYRKKEIDFDEFVDLGQLACAEGAVVGLATALGQTLIPIPILGSLVGAASGKLLAAAAKRFVEEDSARLQAKLTELYEEQLSNLDDALRADLTRLMVEYEQLGELTSAAFDVESNVNLRLGASVRLARTHGVDEGQILHSVEDLDAFMTD